ncbi:chemotaxis protein CheW [Sutcliffiella cohnii]|uniref:CheW-like domain-containing protein n=1 Tax=Sutcliffiella cohnii TaxID=33932 RepID=A0A223KSW7_9BACI|nr:MULTISPECIES: chemotaxis protein CheW [Sutcliffiella]AST92413.1 hypothetical protein BC6307_14485 [Sutcliffiella cohnii]MED4017118.1 chemotaxis protein CheW [Sutcliffiella cohnii]WBL13646.1 chemotaxis protein CheW [Sutcliffiella sp. NC1]
METIKLVVFEVNGEEYGIAVQDVISIEKVEKRTMIPNMPEYLYGMAKVREELIPVIDTKYVFYRELLEVNEKSKVIVVQSNDLPVGLMVDDAKEIIDVNEIKPINEIAVYKTPFVAGVIHYNDRLITQIKVSDLVSALEELEKIKELIETEEVENYTET